ncbi:MAG: hypothetical protein M5U01_06045 [Ardenticatenaceae bacterium]|nr:hypothetical protein [Ardenticatenaceae bacterium]
MARNQHDLFEWQVWEEDGPALEALEWEEDWQPADRSNSAGPATDRHYRGWRLISRLVVFVLVSAAALLWWRTRQVNELVRRDVQQVVSQEVLAWQAHDPDQFEALLDDEADRSWRSREIRRFRWLQAWWPDVIFGEQGTVESVVLLGDRAEAQVLYESDDGQQRFLTTNFYRRLANDAGWRRTSPDTDQWGPAREASTRHFHFVYHTRDAAAVETLIPDVERFYVRLQHDVGALESYGVADTLRDALSTRRITVTVEPRTDIVTWRLMNDRVSLVSPALQMVPADSTPDAELRRALARPLTRSLVDEQPWVRDLPTDGRNFAHAIGDWEAESWSGAPSWAVAAQATVLAKARARGQDLSVGASRFWTRDTYNQLWHAHSYFLADYVADRYGRQAFAPILQAWRTGRSWSEVLPAALGVSRDDFEAGWEAYLRRFDTGWPVAN